MNDPLVTLIILNWNGEAVLKPCIESLLRQSYINLEIIVIDNRSTDNSIELLKKYSEIILIRNATNIGFAASGNIGFARARGKYVAVLNNDIAAEPSWLQNAIPLFEKDPTVGIVGSRQMNFHNRSIIDGLYQVVTQSLNFYHFGADKEFDKGNPLFSSQGVVIGAGGAAALYRKKMIDEIGGFDEQFFAYHEDSDLNLRAFWNGWKCIYEPNSIVYHVRSHSFGYRSSSYVYYFERNRYWFMVKNYPLRTLLLKIPFFILSEIHCFKTYVSNADLLKAYLKGRKDCLFGLNKILRKRRKFYRSSLIREFRELKKRKIIPCA